MSFLFRILFRKFFVNGKPSHQIILGIILIPFGLFVSFEALYANPDVYYPYYALLGVVFAIFGIVLVVKGARGLKPKPAQPQMAANYPTPYPPYNQQPYNQTAYPTQAAPQPYNQPAYPTQAAPQPYGQPVYPPTQAPQQPYGQTQYPQD